MYNNPKIRQLSIAEHTWLLEQIPEVCELLQSESTAILRADLFIKNADGLREGYLTDEGRMHYSAWFNKEAGETWNDFVKRSCEGTMTWARKFNPLLPVKDASPHSIAYYLTISAENDFEETQGEIDNFKKVCAGCTTLTQFQQAYTEWNEMYIKQEGREPHEVDFPCWEKVYALVEKDSSAFETTKVEEVEALLFLLDKDWELGNLLSVLEKHPPLLLFLFRAACRQKGIQ